MFGPGWIPLIMKAAIIRAITAFSGMPMLMSGMKLVRAGFVSGRLPRHSLDRSGADLVFVLAEFLVDPIRSELGDDWTATGQDAEERPDHTPAQRARNDALELRPRRNELDLAVERRALVAVVQ